MIEFRVPVATYRLQLNAGFGFKDAEALTSYLEQLGITDIYASPIFKARPGSTHGYDVIDPTQLNPELGSTAEFENLIQSIRQHRLGLLLDIVPNHMGISTENPFWMDFLQNGDRSPYASFFDVDREPDDGGKRDKIQLPILGKPYGQALEDQEITLVLRDNDIYLQYFGYRLPLTNESLGSLLGKDMDSLSNIKELPGSARLRQILNAGEKVTGRSTGSVVTAEKMDRRLLGSKIRSLITRSSEFRELLSSIITILNGEKGKPRSFDKLDNIIEQQLYRLLYWKTGRHELNYRRFFDIDTLIGVRVELPAVLEATHALVFRLIREGKVQGLRIDHIDGLYDPLTYLKNLQKFTGRFYIIVEKILSGDEILPGDWPVHGTTGYDFAREVNNLFIDAEGLQKLDEYYTELIQKSNTFADIVYEKKKLVVEDLFFGEMDMLAGQLFSLAKQDRYARDLSRKDLTQTLIEVTACLPVYRTYTHSLDVSPIDKRNLEFAFSEARRRQSELEDSALGFLRRVFLLEFPELFRDEQKQEWLNVVMKWQQLTGPATAKGLEDTALYNYNRLTSLNVIGAGLQPPDFTVESFHRFNLDRQAHWPLSMNATSTHDTKRSEDVSARINVLSERHREWSVHLSWWRRMNYTRLQKVNGETVPDPNTEEFLYQNLLGSWPFSVVPSSRISDSPGVVVNDADNDKRLAEYKGRFKNYMLKAVREAKVHTNWIRPNQEYEQALQTFIDAILNDTAPNDFLDEFIHFKRGISFYGAINSLSQALLKVTSPGSPDFYQGTELWDLSLVDPDNRWPVDFGLRQKYLQELQDAERGDRAGLIEDMLDHWRDGRVKLYLTHKALNLRREQPETFRIGEYLPLKAEGKKGDCVVAFARHSRDSWAIVVVPRLSTSLVQPGDFPFGKRIWDNCMLAIPEGFPRRWLDIFTGKEVVLSDGQLFLAQAMAEFPAGLLVNIEK